MRVCTMYKTLCVLFLTDNQDGIYSNLTRDHWLLKVTHYILLHILCHQKSSFKQNIQWSAPTYMYLVSLIQRYDLTCSSSSLHHVFFCRVELQGQEVTKLPIKGCVVERTLELLDQDQRKIECLQFGATYYGTDRTEWA